MPQLCSFIWSLSGLTNYKHYQETPVYINQELVYNQYAQWKEEL